MDTRRPPSGHRRDEEGISLLEAVVAWALALTVLLGTLGAMSTLRKSYARTEARLDAAERARMGVDMIAHDLRLAGLGVDPDGAPGRPDEAIEGAWAGAVALRADLDGDDPDERDDPERWIAGAFPSMATGNDEVVVYALRKESGSGGGEITFEADVFSPTIVTTPAGDRVAARDGAVETVRLPRVVAAAGGAAGAGCTLYRARIANNASLWGTGSAIVWQPLSDSISTLSFRYFDESGEEIAPPGGAESARPVRRTIARVEVHLVALERRADPEWIDTHDPNPATVHLRKADVMTAVFLENARSVARPG